MTSVYAAVQAAYTAAGAAPPVEPANATFVMFFILPEDHTQATAVCAALRADLGASYLVGQGTVDVSVEYLP